MAPVSGVNVVLTGEEVKAILEKKRQKAIERSEKKHRQYEIDPTDRSLLDKSGAYLNEAGKYEFIIAHLAGDSVVLSLEELEQLINPDRRLY